MTRLSDEQLGRHLDRRTSSARLGGSEREELVASIGQLTATAPEARRGFDLFARRLLPAAAMAAVVVVAVLVLQLPRVNTLPGSSPAAPAPVGALHVLTTNELASIARDSAAEGQIVLSDTWINEQGADKKLCGRDGDATKPCAIGVLADAQPSIRVIAHFRSIAPYREYDLPPVQPGLLGFKVLADGIEYLGPVVQDGASTLWTVDDVRARDDLSRDPHVLLPVAGWLVASAPFSCPAPQGYTGNEDLSYYCVGSWLSADRVYMVTSRSENSMSGLGEIPGALHVQVGSYETFAVDPSFGDRGAEPRYGVYLVRSVGCPMFVMGGCPVWELVGRLDPPASIVDAEPSPSEFPLPTNIPAPPPITELRWSVEPFLPESAAQPAAITEVGGRLIVTGSDQDGPVRRPIDSRPAAWYSDDDGVTWDGASIIGDDADRRPQALGSVAGNEDLLLSLGWVHLGGGSDADRRSVLWASTDRGATWERIPGDAVPPRLHDLAAGGPGFVAVGNANPSNSGLPDLDPPHAAVWVSADGQEWERIDGAGFQLARMNAITERDGLLVAAGSQRIGEDDRPAIWRSSDGRQWSRVELSASPGWVRSVAADQDWFVAVGGSIQEGQRTVAWLSPDGLTWTSQVLDPMPGGRATGVAVNGIGFVAIGTSAQTVDGLGSVWFAPVGGAASRQTVRAYMYDVVGAGNRFVGLGGSCGPQADCLVSHLLVIGRPVAP